jgi:hypothetical protein
MKAENDDWHGIEWNVLWQSRNETLDSRLVGRNIINKDNFTFFLRTGKIDRLGWMFGDEQIVTEGLEAFYA